MINKRLLVVITDRLSNLVKKGEITARYYNPGSLFEEVHILMTNDDVVNPEDVKKTVGGAKLFLPNLGKVPFHNQCHESLLKPWAKKAIQLASNIKPDLIRAYGNGLNGYLAAHIKKALNVPYIVSLHTNPEENRLRHYRRLSEWKRRLFWSVSGRVFERNALEAADSVVIVYGFQRPYALSYRAKHIELIYNIVNGEYIRPKNDYRLHNPIKVVNIGRQIYGKNPCHLIEAIAEINGAHLTLIGDGEVHSHLKMLAKAPGLTGRVQFIPSLENDKLCQRLPDYDIFVSVNHFGGISKCEIEAALTGMPIITNCHPWEKEPEVLGGGCLVVKDSKEGYMDALQQLISNDSLREDIGKRIKERAQQVLPDKMEKKMVDLYLKFL